MSVNQVFINGEEILSTRGNTVTENTLVQGETAQDKTGKTIKGELDPVTEEELDEVKEQLNELSDDVYKVSDEEGEIEETDYIPFNDISDVEKPKKKALLSSIIDKIKSAFLPKTWGHVELIQSSDVLTIKDKEVDATESDNGVTAIHYPSSNSIVDNESRILSRYEAVVKPNGDIYAKMYARNYDANGNTVGSNSIEAGVDKSGNNFYFVTDPDKFRKAINTIDQMGTRIPANSDLDDYVTAGTYYVENNSDAGTISNMPFGVAYSGKLIVLDMDSNVRVDQIYITNFQTNSLVYMYIRQIGNDGVARPWREITAPHTYEVGTSIPSNADLNDYITAGVYKIAPTSITSTISNMPVQKAGKLVVLSGISNNEDWFLQMYYDHEGIIYVRRRNNSPAWSEWKQFATTDDITPANVGNGYAEATVSGSAITATITGFKLRAGVIVALKITTTISSACTLNINNTGAKTVTFWDNQNPSIGKPINYGINLFMYDGTYYRRIGFDRTPIVGVQDYVADTSGNELIEWGYSSNKVQLKHSIGGNKLRWNYYKNSAWRGDVNIADYDDLITWGQTAIPTGSDLNNYNTIGVYSIRTASIAQNTANIPIALSGKLIVVALTSTDSSQSWKAQFYIPNHEEHFYQRVKTDNDGWRPWVEYANTNQLGASVAKVGKSILPVWNYPTNVRTHNGITFTFNPSTGEITANGTATDDANCILAGSNVSHYYKIPKGTYVLSGCPSGGADSKYYIALQMYKGSTNFSERDYGSGNTFTLDSDAYCNFSVNNNYYLLVKSGQTVSNIVFKPMLRPAFTTADFEPCEDIHKGNCYVGTCTTAGGTKDKVAYVDGYFVLRKGVRVAIKFSNNNTYSNVTSSPITLNVNGTGAKNIWGWQTHSGAGNTGVNTTFYGTANRYTYYVYDGTYWVFDGHSGDNDTNDHINSKGKVTAESGANSRPSVSGLSMAEVYNNGYPTTYGNVIRMKGGGDSELIVAWSGTSGKAEPMYFRSRRDTTDANWSSWDRVFSQFYPPISYCTCTTAEATTAKVASTLSNYYYALIPNTIAVVKFSYAVPANATLNINSQGAKNIWYRGANITANVIKAGDLATFIYDGTRYQLVANDRWGGKQLTYVMNAGGTLPSILTIDDDNLTVTQCFINIDGNTVSVAIGLKFTSAKTYSSNTLLIHGFPKQAQGIYIFVESSGKSFYLNDNGYLYMRTTNVTAGQTLWGVQFTYITNQYT